MVSNQSLAHQMERFPTLLIHFTCPPGGKSIENNGKIGIPFKKKE